MSNEIYGLSIIAMLLLSFLHWWLALDLVSTMKKQFPDEWVRVKKPDTWFIGNDIFFLYHVVAGKFLGKAPKELISQYKTLRVIDISLVVGFLLLIISS